MCPKFGGMGYIILGARSNLSERKRGSGEVGRRMGRSESGGCPKFFIAEFGVQEGAIMGTAGGSSSSTTEVDRDSYARATPVEVEVGF